MHESSSQSPPIPPVDQHHRAIAAEWSDGFLTGSKRRGVDYRIQVLDFIKALVWNLASVYAIEPRTWSAGIGQCQRLAGHDLPTTIGKLSKRGDDPEAIAEECIRCSNAMKSASTDCGFYLSLKPPALEFDQRRVLRIAETAFNNGQGILFDAHDYDLAQPTIDLLSFLIREFGYGHKGDAPWRFGIVLPTRWRRSISDLHWAGEHGVRVRFVKGEFKASTAFETMDPAKGLLRLIERLPAGVPEVAIATHDRELAKTAIHHARQRGAALELELLFGMPTSSMVDLAKSMAVPLRFYIPYGETLLVYGIKHFLTNPKKLRRFHLRELLKPSSVKIDEIVDTI
jgi:proline dehydrogenase